MEAPTPDPDATVQTVDTFGHAIDDALGWDVLEEQQALAQIESSLFARARDPVRLSRYLLLRPLGSGGTGVVYDGYDPELARRVAVKVLRSGRNEESVARARARFLREAQSIARLSHPNVIAVYDVGTYRAEDLAPATRDDLAAGDARDAGVFIVMELVEGHDLASWLDRKQRTWREMLDVFLAAGQGLAGAHEAGIVHRDFKPGNVLVGDDGRVKVVDFGLALTYGGSASSSGLPDTITPTPMPPELASLPAEPDSAVLDKLTRTGVVLGTPAYMAPEQHRGEPADQKADQFAFCASLYRALCGRHPYGGRKLVDLFNAKMAEQVRPVPEDRVIPAWVLRVLMRGLSADPARRFASMEALLVALRADPMRRARRWARRAAVPLAVGALSYAAYVATRPGQVRVDVSAQGQPVAGAQVYVDDHVLPAAEGEVPAGLHRVRVIAPDHEPAEALVEVQRGGVHEVVVTLEHERGFFDLELEPAGGHVLVDGKDYGSRLRELSVRTGPHRLLLRHDGYVDEQLQWTAVAGQTRRGFVALRKALVWSRPASGSFLESRWLGDANGDGLDDLVSRRFNTLTAYDPWNDREQWRLSLRESAIYRLCDVDGDGARDVVTLWPGATGSALSLFDGRAPARRPEPEWTLTVDAEDAPKLGLAEVLCVPRDGGAALWAAGLRAGVVAMVSAQGSARWSSPLGDEPIGLAARRGPDGTLEPIAVGMQGVYGLSAQGEVRWSTPLSVALYEPDGTPDPRWHAETWRHVAAGKPWVRAAPLDQALGDDAVVVMLERDKRRSEVVALGGEGGQILWRRPVGGYARDGAGDVDGDGARDLLLRLVEPAAVAMVSGASGRPLWSRPQPLDSMARLLMTEPTPLVMLGRLDGEAKRVGLFDAMTGTPLETHDLPRTTSSAPTLVDWDGNGDDDLVLGTDDGVLRAFDTHLQPLGSVPLRIPVSKIEASRDANHDGFVDLLLEARGPAVIVGPKVRWDRRPLDAIRATPVIEDLDGDGELELALFGTAGEINRLDILDARTGEVEVSSPPGKTPIVIRPPALLRVETGFDLFAVGSGSVRRYSGRDATVLAQRQIGQAYADPTLADVDGDGQPELIVVTWEDPGSVHVLDPRTLEPRWSRELGKFGAFGPPSVGDVDGDGAVELVVATLGGEVIALSATGQREWSTDVGGRLNFEPTVADLMGDGSLEVLVTPHLPDDPLVVLDGVDGRERARWPGVATRRARPLAQDVDGDGRPEIFTTSRQAGVFSLDGAGEVRWRHRFVDLDGLQAGGAGSPVLADLDRDGRMELVAGFEDGSLHVVDAAEGTLVWRFDTGREEIEASPAVGDVDGDGRLEVFVAGHDRHLFCLEHGPAPRRPGGR